MVYSTTELGPIALQHHSTPAPQQIATATQPHSRFESTIESQKFAPSTTAADRFADVQRSWSRLYCLETLDRQLWRCDSDLLPTLVSFTFTYAAVFFLQRILSTIDNPTPEPHKGIYLYIRHVLNQIAKGTPSIPPCT
jgi:hypothetical protein